MVKKDLKDENVSIADATPADAVAAAIEAAAAMGRKTVTAAAKAEVAALHSNPFEVCKVLKRFVNAVAANGEESKVSQLLKAAGVRKPSDVSPIMFGDYFQNGKIHRPVTNADRRRREDLVSEIEKLELLGEELPPSHAARLARLKDRAERLPALSTLFVNGEPGEFIPVPNSEGAYVSALALIAKDNGALAALRNQFSAYLDRKRKK